jgi:hypothetical protein
MTKTNASQNHDHNDDDRQLAIAKGMATARTIYSDLFGANDVDAEVVLQIFDHLETDDEDVPLPKDGQADLVTDIKIGRGQAIELFGEESGRKPAVVMAVFERLFEVTREERMLNVMEDMFEEVAKAAKRRK